jgi:glycosyltransferase involved in cell wall biosynthesis
MKDSRLWALKRDLALRIKKLAKNDLVTNIYILGQSLMRHGNKRAVIFPDLGGLGQASDLRGYAIAAELKKFGWRVIVVPYWVDLAYRLKVIQREQPDVIILQQSRHKLNRPSLYPGYNTLFDADDADYVWDGEVVSEVCRTASVSVVGNHHMAEVFRNFGAPRVEVVWTGTYIHSVPGAKPNQDRGDVITWAHSTPQHYATEAAFIKELLLNIAKKRKFTFRIYCSKPEWAREYVAPLRDAGIAIETYGTVRYAKFIESLATVAIGLQPVLIDNEFSRGKSFGKLLAYMAADVAVVASNQVDHPLFYRIRENGMLADNTVEAWTEACLYLLENPAARANIVQSARADFLARLTTHAAAARMSAIMDTFIQPK